MTKTLLIIGAGIEQIPAYQKAKARGLHVVGSDMNPQAPAFEYADDILIASTRNADETVAVVAKYHQQHPIHGVMTIANDVPFTVASVANALGLPGISLESARLASNKLLMKTSFVSHGVACPWFQEVKNEAQLMEIVNQSPHKRFVLKPIDGRGARGVLLLSPEVDLAWAFQESQRWGDSGIVMIEEFIPGLQLSTESYILDSRCYTPGIAERHYDRLKQFAPYVIEDGGTIPAPISGDQCQEIDTLLLKGAAAMGIQSGIIKGDLVINPDGKPMIIELAARLSGGWLATHLIPTATGVDLVNVVISSALGEKILPESLTPLFHRAASSRYWFPEPGIVESVSGEDALKQTPGLVRYGFFRQKGEQQPQIRSHPDRFGYVMVGGENREEALIRVQDALACVKINVQPDKTLV